MQNSTHFKLQNDQQTNDQQQPVVGQAMPQYNYNPYPQIYQPQAQQQNQYQQPQYVSLPIGSVQQGQQVNPAQMSQMVQMPFPTPNATSRYSQTLHCKNCRRPIETLINYEVGNGAYVIGGLMAAVGLWLGCCLIPCLMDDCKDAVHYCPNCGTQIGKKKFLFE